jgi:hypothetical protein
MSNTLGLDDDLDGVELLSSIQASFGCSFATEEAESCRTVGDLYAVLRNWFPSSRGNPGGCPTAMAFYRLKRAFKEVGVSGSLRPGSRLPELGAGHAKVLFQKLNLYSGMQMPRPRAGLFGLVGRWAFFGGLVTGGIAASSDIPYLWLTSLSLLWVGLLMVWTDAGRLPRDCETLGDLCEQVAALNFGQLHAIGAEARDKDLWNALVEILRSHSFLPKAEIRHDTLLLQKHLRSAA